MNDRLKMIVSFVPPIALTLIFFILPIILTFNKSQSSLDGEFVGLERYTTLFSRPDFLDAFAYTIELAVISTIISIVAAIIIGMALRDTFVGKKIVLFLYQTNISIPHLAIATMMVLLLEQSGIISSLACNLGLIETWSDFPMLINSDSPFGAISSFSLKFIPFIGIAVLSVLQSSSRDFEEQSIMLGVGKINTFFHITLSTIKPAIISSSIIVFCYAFGSYEVPMLLGKKSTLATLAFEKFNNPFDPTLIYDAYAISVVIAIISITLSAIYLYLAYSSEEVKQT